MINKQTFINLLVDVNRGEWVLIVSSDGTIGDRDVGKGRIFCRNFENMHNLPAHVNRVVFTQEPPENIRKIAEALVDDEGRILEDWKEK